MAPSLGRDKSGGRWGRPCTLPGNAADDPTVGLLCRCGSSWCTGLQQQLSIGWPGCHGSAALSLTACAGVAELDLGVRGGARVAAQRAGGWNWRWCTGGALAGLEAAQRWGRSGRWCGRRAAARWSRGEARARRGRGSSGKRKRSGEGHVVDQRPRWMRPRWMRPRWMRPRWMRPRWSGPPRGLAAAGLKRAGLGIGFGLLDSTTVVPG